MNAQITTWKKNEILIQLYDNVREEKRLPPRHLKNITVVVYKSLPRYVVVRTHTYTYNLN